MKKGLLAVISLLLVIVSLCSCSPNSGNGNPLDQISMQLDYSKRCADCSIKLGSGTNSSASYYITPEGFDWDELGKKGYRVNVTVSYNVYYKKDWSIGLGYAGSPKYEISVVNSDGMGKIEADQPTSTSSQSRTFSFSASPADMKDTRLVLTFSTDNIQNIIYFSNINVTYKCVK